MIGAKLAGRYEILREIGRGGMGVVYLAYDPMLEREVAVKVVPASQLTPETEGRFRREAKAIARMDHPSVVVVYDTGEHEGSLFFVMPFVPGSNLRRLMQEHSLSLGEVLDVGIQVAEALDYSHLRGIIHRDIKPENILVTRSEDEGFRARLTDFGLAITASEARLTRSGSVVGTVAYLSPEQVTTREVDGRSDLYSLATVLYECFVGETPFTGEIHNVLYRIAHDLPLPPRECGAQIDAELEEYLMRCLDKDPEARPQRARDAAEFLMRYRTRLRRDVSAKVVPASGEMRDFARPSPVPLIGRDREMAELQRRLNEAIAGESQLVVISGEAGAGKTRLLEELETVAKARKIRFLRSRFVEQDSATPFQGYGELLQEYFRQKSTGSSAPADFSDLAPELLTLFPALAEVFETRSPSSPTTRAQPAQRAVRHEDRMAIFELLARSLTRIAGGKPLVVALEDLHSADVSVEALQYIVRRLGTTQTLVAATYRGSQVDRSHPLHRLVDSFLGERRFAQIALGPLGLAEHTMLLQALLGGARVGDSFAQRIHEATEGNPYFTRELVRSLVESRGLIRSESGSWTLSSETRISSDSLPATIQQTVEKRVEGLPPELRDMLSLAAVLGRAFEYRDLEMLVEDTNSLEERLERLIQLGFLQEERELRSDRLIFSSGVIRDVLYARLSRRRRRVLHRKIAEHLETHFAGRLERVYGQLLHHYLQVDQPEKVVEYGLKLARKSLASFSPEEAQRAARTVLDFVEEDGREYHHQEGEARLLLAAALRLQGNVDAALKELSQAIHIFEDAGLRELAVPALVQAAEAAWEARRIEETRRWVTTGLETVRPIGDRQALLKLLALGTTVANMRGDYETANNYMREAEQLQPAQRETETKKQAGGEITVSLPVPIQAIHPATVLVDEESEILACAFETLLSTDASGNLAPCLCERWEVLEKGRSFLFTLRQGIRAHDGRALTSREVKASMETALKVNLNAGRSIPALTVILGVQDFLRGAADHVAGILAFRENKLGIQLTEPLPMYPALLTDLRTGIALEGKGAAGETLFQGTGAFRIVSLEAAGAVLEKNPDYWKSPALLDRIVFRAGMGASQTASDFLNGQLDVAGDFLHGDLEEILRKPRFRGCLQEAPKKNVYFVLFNTNNPNVSDPNIRKALCGVLRTHDLVWQTQGRFAQPAEGLIPPGVLGHDPGRRRQPLSHDQAIALLDSAGSKRPLRLKAAVHPVLQDRYATLTSGLIEAWADIGVDLISEKMDLPAYLKTSKLNEDVDLMIGRYIADYEDPDNFTYGLFHSKVGDFRNYYSSLQMDHLMEEARAETDPSARDRLYRKIENYLLESAVLRPLFHDVDYRLFHPRLSGAHLRSSPPYVNYPEMALAERSAEPAAGKSGGGVLRVPVMRSIDNLDPALTFHASQSEVFACIFENLTHQAEGAQIVPWLASEVQAAEGGRKFKFRLRNNLRFHDGRRVTSRDVRYSFERSLQRSESQSRGWYLSPVLGAGAVLAGASERLEGFRILSAMEFEIELDQPVSFFPALILSTPVAIIPEGLEDFRGGWRDGCVGTGPFRVARFDPGRRLELEPNPHYWRPGFPRCERLIFEFDAAPEDLASGFRKGDFALVWNLSRQDVEALRHDAQFAANYREIPSLSTYYLVFNIHEGPLKDEALRHELINMIDVDDLVRRSVGRLAVPARGLIPPGLLGYEARSRGRSSSHKMQETTETDLSAMIHSAFDGPFQNLSRELLARYRQRGVHVQIQETRSDVPNALVSANADLILSRWMGDYPDADTFAHGLLHSAKGQMGRFCGTPDLDWLIEKARAETSPQARHSIYREVEEMIARRALMLPLFHEQMYRIARPEVQDFELSFGRPNVPYEKLWIRG